MNNNKVVLITGARAPVALHLKRLLVAAGHTVWLADCVRHPLAATGDDRTRYRQLPPFTEDHQLAAGALKRLISEKDIQLVIPTCEEALHLSAIWQSNQMQADLFAPDIELLQQVHNKYEFIQLCSNLGLPTPRTQLLQNPADIAKIATPKDWVFKPVWSRFGSEVLLRPNASPLGRIIPSPDAPWVAQEALEGTEICTYAIAHEGRIVALASYIGMVRAGAAVCFEPINSDDIRDFVSKFVQQTAWTGQISFDFIKAKTGQLMPIECNPRATSGLHFFSEPDGFSKALFGDTAEVTPNVTTPQGVRMALWLYGLPKLFGRNSKTVLRAFRSVEDVISWPDDRISWATQIRSVAEFARIALRERISLQEASTWGIEWNGHSSISY